MSETTTSIRHSLRPLSGRDPNQAHRAATPLELLYDLTLVVAFSVAGSQLAHALSLGHIWPGILAFVFTMFAAIWAWMNYTWFASAYDTDDWLVRIAVLVQMIGVLLLALGIPQVFAGFEHGWQVNNQILVAGYVVMRIPLIALWLKVARDDPARRAAANKRVRLILLAQLGWTALAIAHLPLWGTLAGFIVLYALEVSAPVVAERKGALPWHVHHMTERFGLLAIIALGEGVLGTFTAIQALIEEQGWTVAAVVVLFSGVTLTFGMWWVYFVAPAADMLTARRNRMYAYSYGHLPIYMSIAAVGAGLHVAALYVEGHSSLGLVGTVLSIVIPTAIFIGIVYAAWPLMMDMPATDTLHIWILVFTAAILLGSVGLAVAGVGLAWCLGLAMFAPWVSVIGFETIGHRHVSDQIADLRKRTS